MRGRCCRNRYGTKSSQSYHTYVIYIECLQYILLPSPEQRKAPLTINYVAALSNIDDATSMQCILTTIKDKSKLEGLGQKLKMVVEEYYGRNTIHEMLPTASPSSDGGSNIDNTIDNTTDTANNSNNMFNFFNQQTNSKAIKIEGTNELKNADQRYLNCILFTYRHNIAHQFFTPHN